VTIRTYEYPSADARRLYGGVFVFPQGTFTMTSYDRDGQNSQWRGKTEAEEDRLQEQVRFEEKR